MKLVQIDSELYESWTSSHPMNHYMKSCAWARFAQKKGNQPVTFGLYDQNTLIGTALVFVRRKAGIRYLYLPWGPCLSLQENEWKAFFHSLFKFAKKKNAAFIKCGINLPADHHQILHWMEDLGYMHRGFGYGYDGSWQNRYTLSLPLNASVDKIRSHYSQPRKNALKQQELYCIEVRKEDKTHLNLLCEFEKELACIKGFHPKSVAYYEKLMEFFQENAVYVVAYAHLDLAQQQLSKELLQSKYQKDPEALEAKIRILNQIKRLQNEHGSLLPVAAALYLTTKQTAYNLTLYQSKEFRLMHGCDAIHHHMIEVFKNHQIQNYDFCGFSGSTDVSDPYYGLYQYKSSFGSEIVEMLGEFNAVIDRKKTIRFHKTNRCYRNLRRKLNQFFYRKLRGFVMNKQP